MLMHEYENDDERAEAIRERQEKDSDMLPGAFHIASTVIIAALLVSIVMMLV